MKVGIMTFHGADNYGAVLQAYALTRWLEQNGAEPEIIDYKSNIYRKYNVLRYEKYIQHPFFLVEDVLTFFRRAKRKKNFSFFRNKHLPVSEKKYYSYEELKGAEGIYDRFICGSDQIWNQKITKGLDLAYLLGFVEDGERKIAYAPSIGVSNLSDKDKLIIAKSIKSFRALSIREKEGLQELQPLCNTEIKLVCDPVFLLKRSQYNEIMTKEVAHEYIFLYIVGSARENRNIIRYAEEVSKKRKKKLIYLIDGNKMLFHIDGKNVYGCKVERFLSYINNADYVISNSFHATVFSILFHKQFVTYPKIGTSSRMDSLLTQLNLSERIYNEHFREKDIDYTGIDQRISSVREEGVRFLIESVIESKKYPKIYMNNAADDNIHSLERLLEIEDNRFYLCKNKEAAVRKKSRSGGVFTSISDIVLNNHGVVYGRAETAEERDLFRNSKYIQSDMRDCFQQVRADLMAERQVLFSGTGCQIAGLLSYLKDVNTDNLFTIDIVCHGVPSPAVWSSYLKWLENKHKGKISHVNFRDKKYGWKAHFATVTIGNKTYTSSAFRVLFNKNFILRPSCYECPFASLERTGDITLADAWGVEKADPKWNDNRGCSLVGVNTEKGRMLFSAITDTIDKKTVYIGDYLQPNLKGPSFRPKDREFFWTEFLSKDFEAIYQEFCKQNKKKEMKDRITVMLGNLRLIFLLYNWKGHKS